jgi:hypothetical protein
MARTSQTRGFIGKAPVRLKPRSGGAPFWLGNVTSLTESYELERTSRQNFQEAGGAELDVSERVTSYTGEMNVNDISPQNIALSTRGTKTQVAAGGVSGEAQEAWPDGAVIFDDIPDPDSPVTVAIAGGTWAADAEVALGTVIIDGTHAYAATVAGTAGSVEPTWPTDGTTVADGAVTWKDLGLAALTLTTHYVRTVSGIHLTDATLALLDDASPLPLEVDYTKNPGWLIELLTSAGEEYEVLVNGINENDSGNPHIVRYHRVKFSLTSGFARIGNEFAELPLSFTVLKAPEKVGEGVSSFASVNMV